MQCYQQDCYKSFTLILQLCKLPDSDSVEVKLQNCPVLTEDIKVRFFSTAVCNMDLGFLHELLQYFSFIKQFIKNTILVIVQQLLVIFLLPFIVVLHLQDYFHIPNFKKINIFTRVISLQSAKCFDDILFVIKTIQPKLLYSSNVFLKQFVLMML